MISSIRNFIFELPQNFPNDLSLGNIVKKDILAKPQNCLGTHPSANSLLQNQFLALALQKYAKADIKRFQLCLFLLDFLRRIGISLHKICENTGQWKLVFSHILYSILQNSFLEKLHRSTPDSNKKPLKVFNKKKVFMKLWSNPWKIHEELILIKMQNQVTLYNKWSFPLGISSLRISCGFGCIDWGNP